MRAFFALWPDEEERRKLHAQAIVVAARTGGRAIAVEKLHLTLVFLGEVDERTAACLAAGAATLGTGAIELVMARIGCWHRAGVAWIAPDAMPVPLVRLQQGLAAAARDCRVAPESRPYSPHLTLARGASVKIAEARCEPIVLRFGGFCLVRSDLGSGRYEVIGRWA